MNRLFVILILFSIVGCSKKLNLDDLNNSPRNNYKILQKVISSNNKIQLPKNKTIFIDQPLVIRSNFEFKGNGSKIVMLSSSEENAFIIENKSNIIISNLTLASSEKPSLNRSTTGRDQYLLKINKSSNLKFNNVQFLDHTFTCVHIMDSKKINFQNCVFDNIGQPTTTKLYPFYSYDCLFIGGYTSTSDISIQSCKFLHVGNKDKIKAYDGDGIHLQSPKTGIIKNININNCLFDYCSGRGIKIQSGDNISINKNTFKNSNSGVIISMANSVSNTIIDNNNFENCIHTLGTNSSNASIKATNLIVSNNIIKNVDYVFRTSGKSTLHNSIIENNRVENINTYFFDGNMTDSKLNNNTIINFNRSMNKSYYMAILIGNNSFNVDIKNNNISTRFKTMSAIYLQKNATNINMVNNTITLPKNSHNTNYVFYLHGQKNKDLLKKNKVILK